MPDGFVFALPKGRILAATVDVLARAGVPLSGVDPGADRRLMLDLPGGHRVLLVKPSDVPTYVERGVADFGVAGRDTLEEQNRDLYEPVDLGIGACRLVVAGPAGDEPRRRRGPELRVATKYPRITDRHFRSRGISAEIIPLYGSIELAAVTGLADRIVDLVESGETLRQNHLVELQTVMQVTSRLVVNPATLKLRSAAVAVLVEAVRAAVGKGTR